MSSSTVTAAAHASSRTTAPAPSEAGGAPSHGVRLALRGLTKCFGPCEVLRGNDLVVEPGEFVAIVGRSGCGKSTLLRLVAGLDEPSGGSLRIDGRDARGLRDDTRIMFQDSRLLPWRRVQDNVALGLPPAQRVRATEVLQQVGLAERGGDWPARLSGGQRQRVALARALVHKPRLLLLDEPLGALDALTRIGMQQLIEDLWLRHGFTALLVTHDVQEAVVLADRVILIEDGRIVLDERVPLARPRSRGDAAFAALEKRILDRVLQREEREPDPSGSAGPGETASGWPGVAAHGLRWAI